MAFASIIVLVTVCLYLYFTRTFGYWRARNIAGPTPVPIFGNLMESALRRKHMVFVMKKIHQDFPDEKVVGIYRMTTPSLLIRDPDIIKQVLIKDFDNFADRGVRFDHVGLGTNLIHSDEKTWRILRNKFTPLFSSGKLKKMLYLINEKGDSIIKYIENMIQKQPEQEIYKIAQAYTMTTIATCGFGLDLDITKGDTMDEMKKLNDSTLVVTYGSEIEMMYPGLLYKIGASVYTKETKDFFTSLVRKIIAARKGKPSDRKDFMDLMLELRQAKEVQGSKRFEGEETRTLEITEDIMAGQAFVFYAAGYEGGAITSTYLLYYLALNPDIQERVVAEIKQILKRHGGVSYDALKELIYMDRVIDEVLRMHPTGEPLARGVTSDYATIPGTNVTLKKGQTVHVSVRALHYDEKYWPNPTKFDPDRFSPENSAKRHPAVYLPFGIGPRKCIALQFSKLQVCGFMVKLLPKFRFEATERTRDHDELRADPYRMGVLPADGITLKITPREID